MRPSGRRSSNCWTPGRRLANDKRANAERLYYGYPREKALLHDPLDPLLASLDPDYPQVHGRALDARRRARVRPEDHRPLRPAAELSERAMADDKVRLGQVVGVFGPGAMLDLPERSVLVQGLDHWEMFGTGTFQVIEETASCPAPASAPFDDDGRLVADRPPELRTPPIDAGDPKRPSPGIKATVFPRWFACDAIAGDPPNRRRLVRFQDLEPPKRLEHKGDDGKRRKASPIRFVCGCENGHLQDIDWRRVVHQNVRGDQGGAGRWPCREQMWLEDAGTSADPRDTRIVCDCGASLSLEELFPARPPRPMSRRTAVDRRRGSEALQCSRRASPADPQRDQHLLPAGRPGHLAAADGRRAGAAHRDRSGRCSPDARRSRTSRRRAASIRQ